MKATCFAYEVSGWISTLNIECDCGHEFVIYRPINLNMRDEDDKYRQRYIECPKCNLQKRVSGKIEITFE